MLEHLRRERDDLHVPLLTQLARHRSEDAGRPGLALIVDQHHRVLVEPDVRPVLAAGLLHGAHDDRLGHVALLYLAGRDRVLDGHDHLVADPGIAPAAAAEHPDDQRAPGSRVVGHLDDRFLLDHLARSTISITRHRTVLASGRVSMMRTVSPVRAPSFSSRAFTLVERVICLPYCACAKRRVIVTVTVWVILSLVTAPVRVLRWLRAFVVSVMVSFSPSGYFASSRVRSRVLIRAMSRRIDRNCIGFSIDSVADRNRSLNRASVSSASLALRSSTVISVSSVVFIAQSSWRWMNRVRTGSFADASASAFLARSSVTPSTSKMIRPGRTTATQPSGFPLPLPMRVSAGF